MSRAVESSGEGGQGVDAPIPVWSYLVLFRPRAVQDRLRMLAASRAVPVVPNVWQVTQGVLRMWGRVLFRSETIGQSRHHRVRDTWRARMLRRRPLRFPFLLAERAVAPLDFSGLLSDRERILRHLLGAHHDGNQFAYDLQILATHEGALEALRRRVQAIVSADDPARTKWLRDLTVYEGYHEALLQAVERALRGDFALPERDAEDPDISFHAYLRWCAAQPRTPPESARAWWASARERLNAKINS